MKYLSIVVKNLLYIIKNKTIVFILLILGVSVSLLSFNILIGQIKNDIDIAENSVNTNNTFTLSNIDLNTMEKLIDFEEKHSSKLRNVFYIDAHSKQNIIVGLKGDLTDSTWVPWGSGRDFSGDDSYEVIITSRLFKPAADLNSMYLIGESEYELVGVMDIITPINFFNGVEVLYDNLFEHDENELKEENSYISQQVEVIPIQTFVQEGFSPDIARFHFDGKYRSEYDQLYKELLDITDSDNIYLPLDSTYEYGDALIERIIQAVILIGVSFLNIISLFNFLIYSREKNYNILSILGCSKNKIRLLIICEWIVIYTISFLLYVFLTGALFDIFINFEINLRLTSIFEAFYIYLFGLMITLITCIKTIFKISKRR